MCTFWVICSIYIYTHTYMKVKVAQSCLTLCNPVDYTVQGILRPEYWMGSLSLLQGIFPAQGSNPGLPHCRWILYQLSHQGSPYIYIYIWLDHATWWILVPQPGIKPMPPSMEVWSLNHWTTKEVPANI